MYNGKNKMCVCVCAGFVAYRNVFIRKLCEVFRANADKFHVKEIATLVSFVPVWPNHLYIKFT